MSTATKTLQELDNELNEMILEGKILEAFRKFYAPECVLQDGSDRIEGKEANLERETRFVEGLTELRVVELHDVAIGDDVTMSTWHFDYTHEDWGTNTYDQVAVRKWKDSQIVEERFYKES